MMSGGANARVGETFRQGMTGIDSDSEPPPSPPALSIHRGQIQRKRNIVKENLQKQATEMMRGSVSKFPPGKAGDTVRVRIPDVDRGRCAPRNVIGVITNVDKDKDLYL